MPLFQQGLIAPQNTFLESIIRKFSDHNGGFLLVNTQLQNFPIVYVSKGFKKLFLYEHDEIIQKNGCLYFMHGEQTQKECIKRFEEVFQSKEMQNFEMTLYKKNKTKCWININIAPILDQRGNVVIHFVLLSDISSLREPIEDDIIKGSFSKFARLARSVARNKYNPAENEQADSTTPISGALKSCELPHYKHETPQSPPHVLLHYSHFKSSWDLVLLLLTMYSSFMVPYTLFFGKDHFKDKLIYSSIDRIVDIIFLTDVVLNFHTTFVGTSGEVVSDPAAIRSNYLRSWFFIDFVSSLPYGLIDSLWFSTVFTGLKVVRILRIKRVFHYFGDVVALTVLMMSFFILLGHWLACIWFSVGLSDLRDHNRLGWIPELIREMNCRNVSRLIESKQPAVCRTNYSYSEADLKTNNMDHGMLYATSLYFTLSLITSIGFGNVAANTMLEKTTSILFMLIGALVYATIFGNVTTILQQTHAARARYQEMMNNVKDFIRIHSVPKELSERVCDYITSSWTVNKGVDTDMVLNFCPKDMKADLCVHLYRSVLAEHQAFCLASDSCLRALAVAFATQHCAPGDLIFHKGESIDQICFVGNGSLEVVQDDEVVAILSKGDIIGQPFWEEEGIGQSTATVKALTYCDLTCIKGAKLMEILSFYQAFANSFKKNFVLTVNLKERFSFQKLSDVRPVRNVEKLNLPESIVLVLRKILQKIRKSKTQKNQIFIQESLHDDSSSSEMQDEVSELTSTITDPEQDETSIYARKVIEEIKHSQNKYHSRLDQVQKKLDNLNCAISSNEWISSQTRHAFEEELYRLKNEGSKLVTKAIDMQKNSRLFNEVFNDRGYFHIEYNM